MGMQFEYDEDTGKFFYLLLSLWVLVLFPTLYYFWPQQSKAENERLKRQCCCPTCVIKRQRQDVNNSWQKYRKRIIKFWSFVGWIVVFITLTYKVSQIQADHVEYDPFTELGVDREASQTDIKKAYRMLSLVHHPDKGGDEEKFMSISKAYAALTDEVSKKNWEEYGNPDGPEVAKYGIALPKWLVEEGNTKWMLLIYFLLFIIILPLIVRKWWSKASKRTKDDVLLYTRRLYSNMFQKYPYMKLEKVIKLLGASFEFSKEYNPEIKLRASDDKELRQIIRELPAEVDANAKKIFSAPYCIKARTLLYAHFERLSLPKNSLDVDLRYILRRCPSLITEMINMLALQIAAGLDVIKREDREFVNEFKIPSLKTIDCCMELHQMIMQGLEAKSSPWLQLPHINQTMLEQIHIRTRKGNIRHIRELAKMTEEDRRHLFEELTDAQYKDVMNVYSGLPVVDMTVMLKVLDAKYIRAGDIVMVTVTLKRTDMMDENVPQLKDKAEQTDNGERVDEENESSEEDETEEVEENASQNDNAPLKLTRKHWQKSGKGKKKGNKSKPKRPKQKKNSQSKRKTTTESKEGVSNEGEKNEEFDAESESEDEDGWEKFQAQIKEETELSAPKKKDSVLVHCPYYPEEKQEGWWLFIGDTEGTRSLVSVPIHIQSLKTEEKLQLKFRAPDAGFYSYTVFLKSDSYIGFDQSKKIKLVVKKAKKINETEEDSEGDSDYDSDTVI